ncbi:DUF402 domain-containing protein [Tengunoibacter tsumagoiensis]|nr:DUF402 domain-containing protein [Tengunoibacter tsumagoiensis]
MLQPVQIRKMLVDGDQWAGWQGYHIPMSENYFAIWTPIGTTMNWQPGVWTAQKHSLMYFWKESWSTIQISYDEEGKFVSGYCDVVLPTTEYSNTASEMIYTDLYIDVVIQEDYTVFTKDQEVFERAARTYPIVEQSRQSSFAALDWLEAHARSWTGPFTLFPQRLPRTDLERLTPEEAAATLQALIHKP